MDFCTTFSRSALHFCTSSHMLRAPNAYFRSGLGQGSLVARPLRGSGDRGRAPISAISRVRNQVSAQRCAFCVAILLNGSHFGRRWSCALRLVHVFLHNGTRFASYF